MPYPDVIFALSVATFIFCCGSFCLFVKEPGRRIFLYSGLFFLCSTIAILGERYLELGLHPQHAIIWHKAIYCALFGYILVFPLFISSLTGRVIARSVKVILFLITLACISITIFTDTVISNQTYLFGGVLQAQKGHLYPLVLAPLLGIPGYFYIRLIVDIRVKQMRKRYIILGIGIAVGFIFSLVDIVGVFRGKPVMSWLRSPHMIGIFVISMAFAYSFLSQYTWVFSTLTRSQNEIERLMAKSNRDFMEFVQLIAKTLDAKDKYTAGHSLRVMDYAMKIAKALQIPVKEVDLLKQACLLHDIGKISIPDGILNKKKKLTMKEREYILDHPVVGKKILSTVSDFKEILDIIYAHHERIDGSGYPDGRMHNDIPFLARILAVADTYDAMRSERPYRPAKTKDEAIEELILAKGSQLDAEVVDIFIEAMSSI